MKENQPKKIIEQKCPSCGAPLEFNPETGRAECKACGNIIEIDDAKNKQKDNKIDRKERDTAFEQMGPLPIYHCVSCGAQVIAESQNVALTCPYCANNIVLTDQLSGTLKPDGIVPFKFTSDELPKKVKAYYKNKRLLPSKFFTKAQMGNVTGIYVPFWVFDCNVEGDVSYTGEKFSRSYRQGDYVYREYKVYRLDRSVYAQFENLPVDASEKMDDALMDSIEPFDLSEVKPFDPLYLSGFVADRFDLTSEEMKVRAHNRVRHTASTLARKEATSGYSAASEKSNHIETNVKRARYILLPVYIFSVSFENIKYSFAVNGQTGKVVGKLPIDKKRKMKLSLGSFAVSAAALFLLLSTFFR